MIVGEVKVLLVRVSVDEVVTTFTPSIETTPAETLAIVVSVACPSSTLPTPSAVEVEAVIPLTGRPVALVRVPDAGVPRAPPDVIKVADAGIVVPLMLVAVAAPNTGVTSVGEVPNTKAPVPVSSEMTPASSAEVVAASADNLSVVTTRVLDVGIVVELIVKELTFVTVAPEAIDVEPSVGAE